ncbi:MAG: AAA family ATPase [Methanothrix sp.]|nr:AAA family ATPase [Methanothrix sp.]MCX8206450.1 AAA family ATPase [Methanothrix sp.]
MSYDPVSKWEEFIRSRYWDDLLKLAESYPSTRSLIVDFADLDRYDTEFADDLLENPDVMLDAAHTALQDIVLPVDVDLSGAHVRVVNLPQHLKTRDLRSDHIGKLIAIEGQVRTATEVRPKIVRAAYECQRCGHVFYVEQSGTKFIEPYECPNEACDRRGPFRLLPKRSQFVDAQKVRVQESPEDLRGGEQPQTLDVELGDDLVGRIFPGDRVIINGILRSYQRTTQSGKSTYFDLFLDGISIEMMEQEFEEIEISPEDEKRILELSRDPDIYGKIVRSIAPSIYGYEDVKEALALQLVSGFSKRLPDGARIRGDIHILLVGDPGVAKSQLLRYMAKLSPRGIYTSGKSSTSAGLTATAIKDELGDGRWTIEAGALVLADKGIAAVDEMDKMSPDDRSALHEAMEQQSYHPLTEIQLSDGRKIRIGEFVDCLMKDRHDEIIRGVDCEILPLNGDIKVWSTDLSRIFELPVDRVSRHRAPDHFIKITYSNGREIIVTPEHPVYIAMDGIACIPACDVTKGNLVPAPRSIQCSTNEPEPIKYLEVVEVELIPNEGEYSADYVYDLTVEPTHTFISQGLVLHNTISVAKAGVMATLKSRCALLAAANPKMGRFDKYEPIAPQINLTPALMSRFDLIFVLTDEPNAERDAHIATHILRSNYAGELSSQRSINPSINDEDIESATEIIKPEIEPELLRKYVAYARKNIFPTLTELAMERFKEYYINLRSQGQDGNKPVPVTARQLEALIRLGEASARLRLSNQITEEDVDRVIRIVESCLKKVGVDPETGMLDADVISIGMSKSTRDKTKLMLNIVRELGGKEGAQIDDVLDRAEAEGIDRERAEEIITRLRQEGSLIQTSRGTLRAV